MKFLFLPAAIMLLCGAVAAQEPVSSGVVMKMTQSGLSEEVIVMAINVTAINRQPGRYCCMVPHVIPWCRVERSEAHRQNAA